MIPKVHEKWIHGFQPPRCQRADVIMTVARKGATGPRKGIFPPLDRCSFWSTFFRPVMRTAGAI
jgi:hypothetical protein